MDTNTSKNLAENTTKTSIQQMPKIDLHRHLDGDVTSEVLLNLTKKDNVILPAKNIEGLDNYFESLRNQGLISLLQNGFGLITSLMQSEENLYTVGFEEAKNLAEDGIVYAEVRFAPQYHTGESTYYGHSKKNKMNYQEIIKAVCCGLNDGQKKYGVKTKTIVCIGREAESELGIKIAKAAIDCIDYGVVALDLACDESTYPPERHKDAFLLTLNTPLKRTVHAGEFGNQIYKNIVTSIKELHADRIGHAISLAKYPDLIDLVLEKEIGIEMNPKSNMYCGFIKNYHELRINQLLFKNVLATVNSDDPAIFGYTLSDVCFEMLGEISLEKLKKMQINAIKTSFLSREEKKELQKLF